MQNWIGDLFSNTPCYAIATTCNIGLWEKTQLTQRFDEKATKTKEGLRRDRGGIEHAFLCGVLFSRETREHVPGWERARAWRQRTSGNSWPHSTIIVLHNRGGSGYSVVASLYPRTGERGRHERTRKVEVERKGLLTSRWGWGTERGGKREALVQPSIATRPARWLLKFKDPIATAAASKHVSGAQFAAPWRTSVLVTRNKYRDHVHSGAARLHRSARNLDFLFIVKTRLGAILSQESLISIKLCGYWDKHVEFFAKKKNKILFPICIPHDSSCDIDHCFREASMTRHHET